MGVSGSIGKQTVDVCKSHSNDFAISGISVYRNVDYAFYLAKEFGIKNICIADESLKDSSQVGEIKSCFPDVYLFFGHEGLLDLIEACECDIVVNALVGAAGLNASHCALIHNKRLCLANKESLVIAGDLLMPLSKKTGELLPVDSEHGAIFQCLVGEEHSAIKNLIITASGGPFRHCSKAELEKVVAKQALLHPTWNMGDKITIDSSTMMNKGLEVVEAHHLFDVDFSRIKVIIQPQSIIHSLVEFVDGSFKAHIGAADMSIPIAYALSYPKRICFESNQFDLFKISSLDFEIPDFDKFPLLKIAYDVGEAGGILPCVMNGANEVANQYFRNDKCSFYSISDCTLYTLDNFVNEPAQSIEQLLEVDKRARKLAVDYLNNL